MVQVLIAKWREFFGNQRRYPMFQPKERQQFQSYSSVYTRSETLH